VALTVIDHVFTDAIGALRESFANSLLERQAFEEHFQSDILTGDLTWETSYGLPGEEVPPRTLAHVTLTWPSWSQAIYRIWYLQEELEDLPSIDLEIVFRAQFLPTSASVDGLHDLGGESLDLPGFEKLEREGVTLESTHVSGAEVEFAAEVTFSGMYQLTEAALQDGSSEVLDTAFTSLAQWIASTLVRLGDTMTR